MKLQSFTSSPPADGNGGLSPHLQLEDFVHVILLPGQTKPVTFHLHPRQLSEVDAKGVRSVQPGKYKLSVGGSQPDDKNAPGEILTGEFAIVGLQELPH